MEVGSVGRCDVIAQASARIMTSTMNPACIREVWATNLEQEFTAIRRTVEDYPYIAMVAPFDKKLTRKPLSTMRTSFRIPSFRVLLRAQ